MSRRSDFLIIMQSAFLRERGSWQQIVQSMAMVVAIPEEVIPSNLEKAGREAFEWVVTEGIKVPDWIKEWRENEVAAKKERESRITITINVEAEADVWWMNAEASASSPLFPKSCTAIVCDRVMSIDVSEREARAFVAWASSIPGWEYNPFMFGKGAEVIDPERL